MDFLILIKFLVDFYWEYKILNILYTIFVVFLFFIFFFSKKINFKVLKSDLLMFFFMILSVFALLNTKNFEKGFIDFFKLFPLFFIYGLGRIWFWNFKISKISKICFLFLILWLISALTGYGYLTWGAVNTFVGGYFFKTDLAIAVLLCATFILSSNINSKLKLISFAISVFLVFLANSRISIPILFLIYFLSMFDINKIYMNLGRSFIIFFISFVSVLILFSIVDFSKFGMIGFNIKDPFSESTTQGRSIIWAAVLEYYNNSALWEKIFGSGLAADLVASEKYALENKFEESRAHNSYLWLMLCTGWIGLITLSMFFLSVISEIRWKIKNNFKISSSLYIFAALLTVFLIMSFSVELIVRTQFTYLLFFYAGLCCNRNQFLRSEK